MEGASPASFFHKKQLFQGSRPPQVIRWTKTSYAMKQDNTVTMRFFRGLRLARTAEMLTAGENPKVFSKKVGLFLTSDTSGRFEDIMNDIINSTKKSDFSDFLLGLSEKACVTGMRGQSFSLKKSEIRATSFGLFRERGWRNHDFLKKIKKSSKQADFFAPVIPYVCMAGQRKSQLRQEKVPRFAKSTCWYRQGAAHAHNNQER